MSARPSLRPDRACSSVFLFHVQSACWLQSPVIYLSTPATMSHMDHASYLNPSQEHKRKYQRWAMGITSEDKRRRAENPSVTGRRELVLLTEEQHHARHDAPWWNIPPVCSGASPGPSEEVVCNGAPPGPSDEIVGPSEVEHRDYCCAIL